MPGLLHEKTGRTVVRIDEPGEDTCDRRLKPKGDIHWQIRVHETVNNGNRLEIVAYLRFEPGSFGRVVLTVSAQAIPMFKIGSHMFAMLLSTNKHIQHCRRQSC